MKLNLLHIDEQTGWRGGEQQVSYLINGLAQRGHNVYLAGRPGSELLTRKHYPDSITPLPIPLRNEIDIGSVWKLAKIIRKHNIDVIHAHTSHSHMLACLAGKLARRGKVLVSRRVDFPPKNDPLNRIKYAMPDGYVAISKAIKDVLILSGVNEEKIRLVHSAIAPERFQVQALTRSKIGIPEDAILLGNIAALVGHKDQETLIHAMPDVVKSIPKAQLVIVGEGKLRQKLEKLISELELKEYVHLLGYRTDVPELLQALDVFVMSSKEEGLGTSVLDAMACRKPVVATAAGGIPEMVIHEKTGLLVPIQEPKMLAEALIRIIEDVPMQQRLISGAWEKVADEFTIEKMVEGNELAYREILSI